MTTVPLPTIAPSSSAARKTPAGSKVALSSRDFSFWYGPTQALDGITLDVTERSITALIGPSGCGKSTFVRSINRINETLTGVRHSGTILLRGQDVYEKGVDVVDLRRRVGMVFQRSNPFPRSIYENVAYGPKVSTGATRRELDEIVESSLRRAALWEEVKDRLAQNALSLSGGQQQRLCIARALANKPEALLLDEPASALDPLATQKIEELLFELRVDLTIVIVTHNLQQAARISDTTAFFYLGKLIETGPTNQIFTSPREDRTEAYITGRFG